MTKPYVWFGSVPDYLPHKKVGNYFVIDWDENHDPGDEDDGYKKALEEYFKLMEEFKWQRKLASRGM